MDKKHLRIVIGLVVLVVVIFISGILTRSSKTLAPVSLITQPSNTFAPSRPQAVELQQYKFTSETPQNATMTQTVAEAPAAPNSTAKLGFYDLKATVSGYNPTTITVKNGDLVQINFTAVDGDYDFSMPYIGLYQFATKGQTKQISFQTPGVGTFLFECRDHCPASGKIQGQLVVMGK